MFTSHFCPLNPGKHVQENPLTKSTHVALLLHGADKQSSIFASQVAPWKPTAQLQPKSLTRSRQVPDKKQRKNECLIFNRYKMHSEYTEMVTGYDKFVGSLLFKYIV